MSKSTPAALLKRIGRNAAGALAPIVAAEVFGAGAFTEAGSISIDTSETIHEAGLGRAKPQNAISPHFFTFERGQVNFGLPTMGSGADTCTIGIFAFVQKGNPPVLLGKSTLAADGTFAPIKWGNLFRGKIYPAVIAVTGSVAVDVYISAYDVDLEA
jgi:hypothetical protein